MRRKKKKKTNQESLGPKEYLPESQRASIRGQAEARGREGHTEERRMEDLKASLPPSQRKMPTSS